MESFNGGKCRQCVQGPCVRHDSYHRHPRREPSKPSLWAAVENNDNEKVAKLIADGANIEEKHLGWSPLMKASEENHVEIMKLLLEHRADIKISNRKGRTALSLAVSPSMGRGVATGTLKLLLEQCARCRPIAEGRFRSERRRAH